MRKKYIKLLRKEGISRWNDKMFLAHRTPYKGIAGLVERARINKVISYSKITKADNVLEVGCEAGNLIMSLPVAQKKVGLDISKKALNKIRIESKKVGMNITTVYGDLMKKLPFKKGDFSVIICSETLEHVLDPQMALRNISAICDYNTRIIITVPNEKPKLVIKKILLKIGIIKWLLPNIETGRSEWHLQIFSRKIILRLFCKYFTVCKIGSIFGLHTILLGKKK
jgi:2-polyprenyl-3-methyl-5-hydroxy-6-metoxy-1,4-benzoquinol methylase